jgi:FkbM family methyltransferase
MDLYGQEPEVRILSALLPNLDSPTVIEVGAEQGGVAAELVDAGAEELHAIDPHPGNASRLRERFAADPRVTVHELAVSDRNGTADLHLSTGPDGLPVSHSHSLVDRPDSATLRWHETIAVPCRTLGTLTAQSAVPAHVGILKIDTEGHDLAVLRGMGQLSCDVVMVEHWSDLPYSLGRCPWTMDEIVEALRDRDFVRFLLVKHHGERTSVACDGGVVRAQEFGNLIFLHEGVVNRLLPVAQAVVADLRG